MRKIGRNDPCPCGSGKKYKKCHLDRASQAPVTTEEALQWFNGSYDQRFCSVPASLKNQCSGQIVRAHTVPKQGSLQRIAENGHVYALAADIASPEEPLKIKRRGINQASTFTGFCRFHDNALFSPLEKQSFTGTHEQLFLLTYRAMARELFTKRGQNRANAHLKEFDRGKDVEAQSYLQRFALDNETATGVGLKDIERYKETLDEMLITRCFDSIRFVSFGLKESPDIMCSGGYSPDNDFEGGELQDLGDPDLIPATITHSSFASESGGHFVFTWVPPTSDSDSDLACRRFVDSLLKLPQSRVPDTLVQFLFSACENIFLRQRWWDALSDATRQALLDRIMLTADVSAPDPPDRFRDVGRRYVDWEITGMETRLA